MRTVACSRADPLAPALLLALLALCALAPGAQAAASDGWTRCEGAAVMDLRAPNQVPATGKWEACVEGVRASWDANSPRQVRLGFASSAPDATNFTVASGRVGVPHATISGLASKAGVDLAKQDTLYVFIDRPIRSAAWQLDFPAGVLGRSPGIETAAGWIPSWPWWLWAILGTVLLLTVAAVIVGILLARRRGPDRGPSPRAVERRGARHGERIAAISPTTAFAYVQPEKVLVELQAVDEAGRALDMGELDLRVAGVPVPAREGIHYLEATEGRAHSLPAQVSLGNPDYHLKGTPALEASAAGYVVKLQATLRTYPLAVAVVDVSRGTPIPGIRIAARHERGAEVRLVADPQGKAVASLPRGSVEVHLAEPSGALSAAPQVVKITGEGGAKCTLNARVATPPLPQPADLKVAGPATASGLALATLGTATLRGYVSVLRAAYDSPDLQVRRGDIVAELYRFEVPEALKAMQAGFEEIFREKAVQVHLLGRMPEGAAVPFAWKLGAREVIDLIQHLEPDGTCRDKAFAAGLERKRAEVDAALTRRTRDLLIRPGVRLLALSDELRRRGNEEGSLPFLLAADAILEAVLTFLEDPGLTREWTKA